MWGYVGFLAIFAVIAVLVWFLDPNLRRGRVFTVELATREPVSNEELFARHYAPDEITYDVPGRVRRVFARHMDYPAEKLLPDDDLMFFWDELDMIDLIRDLEQEFGIEITKADVETVTSCTIRAVSHLVSRKAGPNQSLQQTAALFCFPKVFCPAGRRC